MSGQLKQRIVGIVVLLFLALVIFPWLFGSNQPAPFEQKNSRKKEKHATADFSEMIDEPKQKSKPIPDNIESQEVAIKQENVVTVASPLPEVIPVSAPKKIDQPVPRVTEVNSSKLTNIENAIIHNNADSKNESQKSVKHTPKLKEITHSLKEPHLEKIKLPAKNEAIKSTAKIAEKKWAIQLGSFSNKSNVDKLVQGLKSKSYPVYTKTEHGANGVVTKVFVGPESHDVVHTLMPKIQSSFKVHGVIVKTNV